MKKQFQVPAQITKITTMADKSIRLQVDTQELGAEEKTLVFSLHEQLGWFIFKETPFEDTDIIDVPDIVPEFKNDKSPSQRLRNRLFVYYKETHGGEGKGFEDWYVSTMDKIGQQYLDKINN